MSKVDSIILFVYIIQFSFNSIVTHIQHILPYIQMFVPQYQFEVSTEDAFVYNETVFDGRGYSSRLNSHSDLQEHCGQVFVV